MRKFVLCFLSVVLLIPFCSSPVFAADSFSGNSLTVTNVPTPSSQNQSGLNGIQSIFSDSVPCVVAVQRYTLVSFRYVYFFIGVDWENTCMDSSTRASIHYDGYYLLSINRSDSSLNVTYRTSRPGSELIYPAQYLFYSLNGAELNSEALDFEIWNSDAGKRLTFSDCISTSPFSISITDKNGNKLLTSDIVSPPVLSGLSLYSPPAKSSYKEGEQLDLTGLSVKLSYSDGSEKIVPFSDFPASEISVSPPAGSFLDASCSAVTVTCGSHSIDVLISVLEREPESSSSSGSSESPPSSSEPPYPPNPDNVMFSSEAIDFFVTDISANVGNIMDGALYLLVSLLGVFLIFEIFQKYVN